MRKLLLAGASLVACAASTAVAEEKYRLRLTGYEEVPAVSTPAAGTFRAQLSRHEDAIDYVLSYRELEGAVTQAHVHFGQRSVNGGISFFLCTNLGNGPAGTQPCPPAPATVSGTIRAADVVGPAVQGIEAMSLPEIIAAIRAGVAYANVHTTKYPGGEVRAQFPEMGRGGHAHGHDDD